MSRFDRFATFAVSFRSGNHFRTRRGLRRSLRPARAERDRRRGCLSRASRPVPGGVSSMYWNPATITMNPGFAERMARLRRHPAARDHADLHAARRACRRSGRSGDIGLDAFVPSSYTSYQINDRLWVGLYTGAPFGLDTKPRQIWAGQLYAPHHVRCFSLEAMPTIGYKVNDWLSVGAGVRASSISRCATSRRSARRLPIRPVRGQRRSRR